MRVVVDHLQNVPRERGDRHAEQDVVHPLVANALSPLPPDAQCVGGLEGLRQPLSVFFDADVNVAALEPCPHPFGGFSRTA